MRVALERLAAVIGAEVGELSHDASKLPKRSCASVGYDATSDRDDDSVIVGLRCMFDQVACEASKGGASS
jgi:hypothetical protein